MGKLEHRELGDREKLFYTQEAKFIEHSSLHNRGLATLAATELGFLVTSLTLAGTNETARNVVLANAPYLFIFALLLVVALVSGAFQGFLMAKAQRHGDRAHFLPNDARVEISKTPVEFSEEQLGVLLGIADKEAKKNMQRFKFYSYANFITGLVAGLCFLSANLIVLFTIYRYAI